MSKKYAHQIFGNNLIILFVLQFASHFLDFAGCSLVFDINNQQKEVQTKYCDKIRDCAQGQHVMCMYGNETKKMGPRCYDGKVIELSSEDKKLLLLIMNSYRSKLTRGKETGKGGVPMPRAYGIKRLFWDDYLASLAQVWANQCMLRRDLCRATETFPNPGQVVSQIRFSYPDYDIKAAKFATPAARMTAEKVAHAIKTVWEKTYSLKEFVTGDIIRNYSGSGEENPYLVAIYGFSNKLGCGMSSYLDYLNYGPRDPVLTYTVELVCNFSDKPKDGKMVYATNTAQSDGSTTCGCPFAEDSDCLCIEGYNSTELGPKPKRDENDTTNMDTSKNRNNTVPIDNSTKTDNTNGTDSNNGTNGDDKNDDNDSKNRLNNTSNEQNSGNCNAGDKTCNPSVVLMPIFTIENADPDNLDKLNGLETSTMSAIERRKMQIRQRIRDRVNNVRDRYFNNYVVIEPGTRFSGGGPIDEDSYALTKYEPPNPQPNMNRNGITKYSYSTKKRPNINIKPRRDFSNLEELVSEYLLYKHNRAVNPSNTEDKSFNDIIHTGTALKPYVRPFDNSRPGLQTGFENPQRPGMRKLRFGVQGFNYNKAPYINNFNDDRDQLTNDLYNLEQKSEDIAFKGDSNEMFQTNTRKSKNIPAVQAYPYNNRLRSTKQIRNDKLMDNIDPFDYASDDNEGIPSDIDYDHRTIEAQRELKWPVTRNQNPLHTHTHGTTDFDYYRHYKNGKGYRKTEHIKPQSMLMNLADVHFETDNSHAGQFGYGYSGRNGPYVYDKNELRNYYFDLLKRARPFKRPEDTGFGQSSEFHRRRESDEVEEQKLRYFVPDRANVVHGF